MLLKIIASSKNLYEGEVLEVYAPATKGTMGILQNHENMISTLEVGEMKVKTKDGEEIFVLNGGFIEIKDNVIIVLADEAQAAKDLVEDEVANAIKLAEEKKGAELPPAELIRLEKQLRYEKLKKKVLEM
jgi:F-type H+-transporting ATPase subunit epsilon